MIENIPQHDCALTITVRYSPEGIATPLSFEWIDGEIYLVSHVLSITPGCSRKHGVLGMLYKCKVNTSIVYIVESHGKWYLDRPKDR